MLDLTESMIVSMQAEAELLSSIEGLDILYSKMADVDIMVGRLEGIKAAIEQFGICKPMMMACDPKGELVAAGICCSYEELEDIPVKDSNADAALEEIGAVLKTIWEGLVALLKVIVKGIAKICAHLLAFIAVIFVGIGGLIAHIAALAISATEGMAQGSLESDNDESVIIYQLSDFAKLVSVAISFNNKLAIEKLKSLITAIDSDDAHFQKLVADFNGVYEHYISSKNEEVTGIKLIENRFGIISIHQMDGYVRSHRAIMPKPTLLKDFKYSKNEVIELLKNAERIEPNLKSGAVSLDELKHLTEKLVNVIRQKESTLNSMTDDEAKRAKLHIDTVNSAIYTVRRITQFGIKMLTDVVKGSKRIGDVYLKKHS